MKTDNEVLASFDPRMELHTPKNIKYEPYWKRFTNSKKDSILAEYRSSKPELLMYDKSYDWLMSIVEEIELIETPSHSEFLVDTSGKHCTISSGVRKVGSKKHMTFSAIGETKIEAIYKAVVEFVKWYNTVNN